MGMAEQNVCGAVLWRTRLGRLLVSRGGWESGWQGGSGRNASFTQLTGLTPGIA